MISEPQSQHINREASLSSPDNLATSVLPSLGSLSGTAYGVYKGLKVSGCAAECAGVLSANKCVACMSKSLTCFGITVGLGIAGSAIGLTAGLALRYSLAEYQYENQKAQLLDELRDFITYEAAVHQPTQKTTQSFQSDANTDEQLAPPAYATLFPERSRP